MSRKFSIAVLPLAFAALFGVVAYLIGVLVARGAMHSNPFSRTLPLAGGLALCIAGIYQLTPWKSACLKHCRDPLTLVTNHLHRPALPRPCAPRWLAPMRS